MKRLILLILLGAVCWSPLVSGAETVVTRDPSGLQFEATETTTSFLSGIGIEYPLLAIPDVPILKGDVVTVIGKAYTTSPAVIWMHAEGGEWQDTTYFSQNGTGVVVFSFVAQEDMLIDPTLSFYRVSSRTKRSDINGMRLVVTINRP